MKANKKTLRKSKRFITKLNIEKGLKCTETPTKYLIICNFGQATGLQALHINELFYKQLPEIELPKFYAPKGETYSFLIFQTVETAQKCLEDFNGTLKPFVNGPPIYLLFVSEVPNNQQLYPIENPQGLFILDQFINAEEERKLLDIFDSKIELDGNLKNRKVKHYGYEFRYGSNDVDLSQPLSHRIPSDCDFIWGRLKEQGFRIETPPDQLTVNKYMPGHGIPSHVDKHSPFGEMIISLSLGSSVVMDWKHHSGQYAPIIVPGRSLMVMTGEARYDWQHGIQSRSHDPIIETKTILTEHGEQLMKVVTNEEQPRQKRISLTFRWTQTGPCNCKYKVLCDSSCLAHSDNIDNEVANDLEDLHVHQVYEKIASHFSTTRHKPWPKVVEFIQNAAPGSLIFDLGCGNGKNVLKKSNILQIAAERSLGLATECKRNIQDVPFADCLRMDLLQNALRDDCADCVICIAVIHHFSNKSRRLQAIGNIANLLKDGGTALITVWAKDQSKSNYLCPTKTVNSVPTSQDMHTTELGISLPVHENRTQFVHTDLLVPWKLRKVNEDNKSMEKANDVLLRYYHVFQEHELRDLCREIPSLEVLSEFYEEGNWCVICRKK